MEWTPIKRFCLHVGVLDPAPLTASVRPEPMPKISEREYEELKAFFEAWFEEFPPADSLPSWGHPVAMLKATESRSRSDARLGLGMAINDILEESWGFSPTKVADIDARFNARNILPLSELRRKYSRQFRGILKRGKLRTETEYYLVQGILASFPTGANEAERKLLSKISAAYEQEASTKRV